MLTITLSVWLVADRGVGRIRGRGAVRRRPKVIGRGRIALVPSTSLMELVSLAYAITIELFCELQTCTRGKRTELWSV